MGPGDGWQHRRILLSYRHAQEVGHRRRDVLFDLIRALPAAVLVGVVPGWFWAKLLRASADRAERFTYSVALSVALVPAVILIPARLFGTGVTLAVAIASPLVVFFLGLAAYARFGPAKGSDEPLAPPPAPLGFLGPVLHDWPFIRGVDHYSPVVMAELMMTVGEIEPYLIYPPGFHAMTAEICRLTGLEPLEVFPVVAPTLLLLPALACYALARRVWGWEYGVVAALLSGLILGGTYYYYNDAMYPNLVTSQFLMVVAVAALIGLYASPSGRGGVLLALPGSSTVLSPQVSCLYLAVVLAVVGIVFVPYLLVRDRRKGVALLCSLALLGFLSALYAWDTYDLPRLVAGLLGASETGRGGEAVAMAIGTKPAYDLGHLLATTSQPVAWFGLLGALLAVGDLLRRRAGAPQALAYLTLLFWALLLFVGSRTPLSGFPDRFERDLGIPLAVLGALALVTVLRSLRPRTPAAVALLAMFLAATLIGVQAVRNLEQAAGPSPRLKDRPPPPAVAAAGEGP